MDFRASGSAPMTSASIHKLPSLAAADPADLGGGDEASSAASAVPPRDPIAALLGERERLTSTVARLRHFREPPR